MREKLEINFLKKRYGLNRFDNFCFFGQNPSSSFYERVNLLYDKPIPKDIADLVVPGKNLENFDSDYKKYSDSNIQFPFFWIMDFFKNILMWKTINFNNSLKSIQKRKSVEKLNQIAKMLNLFHEQIAEQSLQTEALQKGAESSTQNYDSGLFYLRDTLRNDAKNQMFLKMFVFILAALCLLFIDWFSFWKQ